MLEINLHPSPIAVLSGDLIHSSDLTAAELNTARQDLGRAIKAAPARLIGSADFFSGDSWQIALFDPADSLRCALFIQAHLKAHSTSTTRISIGIATVEQIVSEKISLSTGKAFTLSGRGLSNMSGQFDLEISLADDATTITPLVSALVRMTSAFVREWTARQSEIASLALRFPHDTHQQIGARLDPTIRKQTVTNALKGANWRAILEALSAFETTDWSTQGNN